MQQNKQLKNVTGFNKLSKYELETSKFHKISLFAIKVWNIMLYTIL